MVAMIDVVIHVLRETIQVLLLVLVMMVVVDIIDAWTRGKISKVLNGEKTWRHYVIVPLIGITPGCFYRNVVHVCTDEAKCFTSTIQFHGKPNNLPTERNTNGNKRHESLFRHG